MDSRETILRRLREAAPISEPDQESDDELLPMVPRRDFGPEELLDLFVQQARAVDCQIHRTASEADALDTILSLIEPEPFILSWDFEHVPVRGLKQALTRNGIEVAEPGDPSPRVGVTGFDAALAATGSLVLASGPGKPRSTSLLPPVHIAVMRGVDRVLPDLEAWIERQRRPEGQAFQSMSSVMVITGPSRTADIAMEPILGMHGPGAVHLVIIDEADQAAQR